MYFSFGAGYALRLLVSIFSLRQHYDGPVTVFLAPDRRVDALRRPLEQLVCDVRIFDDISKSGSRHRIFLESPYDATLVLDSDTIITAAVDDLWEPLEREGVLLTRFHPPPYGVGGTADRPGWNNRVVMLEQVRHLVDEATYADAVHRLTHNRIDINVGVMGIARPRGEAFLADWAERMKRGRRRSITLLDEMLVVALSAKHRHYLAGEEWNCPADEFFRRSNLADARVIHYFADGARVMGIRLGRNPASWAGKKWFETYNLAARSMDLGRWTRLDPKFTGRYRRLFAHGPGHAARLVIRSIGYRRKTVRRKKNRRFAEQARFFAQQRSLDVLEALGYRFQLNRSAEATVIILSYKRMTNIPLIVRSALMCDFVKRVIVSNNNPDVDLASYVAADDERFELVQQSRHLGPSYRYDLAREHASDYYICIDDDVFPSPWQLRRLFRSMVDDPSVPRGTGGEVYDAHKKRLRQKVIDYRLWRNQSQPVDVILQVYAFTRCHLDRYFELVKNVATENSAIVNSEDVIISLAGSGRPILEDVGYVYKCPSRADPSVALHKQDGFFDYRLDLFHRASEVA